MLALHAGTTVGELWLECLSAVGGENCMKFWETFRRDNARYTIDLLASGVARDFRLRNIASAPSLIHACIAARCTSDLASLTYVAERSLAGAGKLAHRLMTVTCRPRHQSDDLFQLNDILVSMSDLLRCVVGEGIVQLVLSDSATGIRCDS